MHLRSMLLIALFATACGDDTPSTPAEGGLAFATRGAHAVGFQVLTVERPDAAPLMVKAWYPTAASAGEIAYPVALKSPDWAAAVDAPTIPGRAAADAPIAAGAHPTIVFSHGFGMNPEWYGELIEHFASRGYVVLAPEHVEHDWFAAFDAAITRPGDVTATLDFVEADAGWAAAIDAERIALVGHSMGGYTALAAAGARIETAAIPGHCADLDPMDPAAFLCAPFAGREADVAAQLGLDAVPETLWPSLKDDRISAIIPISADAWLFGAAGLAEVEVPVMTMGGTDDFGAPWAWSSAPVFAHAASARRALVGLEGGGHFLPVNVCADLPWIESITEIYEYACFDPAWDRRAGLDVVKHYATAFLAAVFDGDAAADAVLAGPAEDAVQLETVLR